MYQKGHPDLADNCRTISTHAERFRHKGRGTFTSAEGQTYQTNKQTYKQLNKTDQKNKEQVGKRDNQREEKGKYQAKSIVNKQNRLEAPTKCQDEYGKEKKSQNDYRDCLLVLILGSHVRPLEKQSKMYPPSFFFLQMNEERVDEVNNT